MGHNLVRITLAFVVYWARLQPPNLITIQTQNHIVYLYGLMDSELERTIAEQTPDAIKVVNSIGHQWQQLPSVSRSVPKSVPRTPRSPLVPIPRSVRVRIRRHLLFVGEMLLLLVLLVLTVGLLRSHIQTTTDQRIGVDVVNGVALLALNKLVWRQATEHRFSLRSIGRPNDESGCREIIFVLFHRLLLRLTGP